MHYLIYTLAKILPAIVAFASLAIYTRYMSTEVYGLFTLVFHGALIGSGVLFNWLGMSSLRYWQRDSIDKKQLLSTLLMAYVGLLLALLVMLWAFSYWRPELSNIMFSGFLLLAAFALQNLNQQLFNAQDKSLSYALSTIFSSALSFAVAAYLAYKQAAPHFIISGAAIGMLLPTIIIGLSLWRQTAPKHASLKVTKTFLAYGLPATLATLVEEVTNSIDRYMLAAMVNLSEAGKYGASYDLSGNSIFMLMVILNLVSLPKIMRHFENKARDEGKRTMQMHLSLIFALGMPALVGLNMVIINLSGIFIGDAFQSTLINITPLISLALFICGLQAFYFDYKFQIVEKTKYILYFGIATAVLNLALNAWLIPLYGTMGAAYATLLSMLFSTYMSMIIGDRLLRIALPWGNILKATAASLVMGLSIYWMQEYSEGVLWLLAQIGLGVLVYTVIALAVNLLGSRDIILEWINTQRLKPR